MFAFDPVFPSPNLTSVRVPLFLLQAISPMSTTPLYPISLSPLLTLMFAHSRTGKSELVVERSYKILISYTAIQTVLVTDDTAHNAIATEPFIVSKALDIVRCH